MAVGLWSTLAPLVLMLIGTASGHTVAGELGDLLSPRAPRGPAVTLGDDEILPVDEAFVFTAEPDGTGALALSWDVRPGYYLYRGRISVAPAPDAPPQASVTLTGLPPGSPKDDPVFGPVRILDAPVSGTVRARGAPDGLKVTVRYQGCAEIGVCYPPQRRTVYLPAPGTR